MADILYLIISFLLGMLALYLTAYSKAKGKNRALQEDILRLEEEKQKVLAKYQAENEELKKQHTLDIEKRKYLYDAKRQQFVKYFELLDEFNGKCTQIFTSQFPPIMSRFLASCMEGDEAVKKRGIIEFNNEVQGLVNQIYEEQLKVDLETNSIRLISSKIMDELLDKLESAVKVTTDDATNMLKFMSTLEFWENQALIQPFQNQTTKSGQVVKTYRDAIRERMKFELNEI